MVTLGGGALVGRIASDRSDDVSRLETTVADLHARIVRAEAERARLRAERNRLEARLAAGKAPPVCPRAYVSSADSFLIPFFSIDYPCGWHVLHDARGDTGGEDRPGLTVDVTFLSKLPISLAPQAGPIADIEIGDWADDTADDEDRLPPLDGWLADERARFTAPPSERRFEGADGGTVHTLSGQQAPIQEPVAVTVMLWEYTDALAGARHVVRVYAQEPSARVRAALDRLARSFQVLRR